MILGIKKLHELKIPLIGHIEDIKLDKYIPNSYNLKNENEIKRGLRIGDMSLYLP